MSKKRLANIDWAFLVFLIGSTYVKLYVKIAVLSLYFGYILYRRYKFHRPAVLNKFYIFIVIAGSLSSLFQYSFSQINYLPSYLFAILTWATAGVISYFVYVTVRNSAAQKLYSTIKAFFGINIVVSLAQLIYLIKLSGHLIPYWYWEPTEYFGGATGDHIYGIFNNISVTNAMISAIGSLYFIFRRELWWSVLCLFVLILCTSNLTLILYCAFLLGLFIVVNKRYVRGSILVLFIITGVVYPFLTLDNLKYVSYVYNSEAEKAQELRMETTKSTEEGIPVDSQLKYSFDKAQAYINKPGYYMMRPKTDALYNLTSNLQYIQTFGTLKAEEKKNYLLNPDSLQQMIVDIYGEKSENTPLATYTKPVKIYTHIQTFFFLISSWKNLFFGAGIGNFSSKQAVKTTGLNLQGSYPANYIYVSPYFIPYHLYALLYVFSLPPSEHSIINMPNSVYNQIVGEYGLIGMAVFTFFYIGFFLKNWRKIKAGRYILALTLIFFGFEYWFEMISLTVIFELLLLEEIYLQDNVTG
jgi:hypothetical protein